MTELTEVSGVGPAAAKKLHEVFITSAELLAVQNVDDLHEKTGLGEGICANIVRSARELQGMFTFRSALEIEKEIDSKPRLKSGIETLDKALLGGLMVGSIVEFYGKASGGKSQACCHYAVRSLLPLEEGGLEGEVVWLDSEKSFSPRILRANAKRWGLDPDVALGSIRSVGIVTTHHLEQLFERIPKLCVEENIKVVVIDSLTGFFRAEYSGLSSLAPRQQRINAFLNQMRRVAMATDVMFLYTNQAVSKPGLFAVANAPVGGHVVAHASDYRFMSSEGAKGKRRLILKDNAGLPNFEVNMSIGWGGFYNDEREKKKTEPDIKEYLENQGISTEIPESPSEEVIVEAEG